MKALFALMIALAPATALAEGGERFPEYYEPSREAPRACVEGKTELFLEYGGSVDKKVWRTCRNGAFVPAAAPVLIRTCKEGKQEILLETDATSGRDLRVIKTCRNGKWL